MGVSLEGVILQGFYYAKKEEGGISMAGRKPKPTAVKKLEGNPGKRKETYMCISCMRTDQLAFQVTIMSRHVWKGTEHLNLMRKFCFRQ